MLIQHLRRPSAATEIGSSSGGVPAMPHGTEAPLPQCMPAPALAAEVLDRQALDRLRELDPKGENHLMERVAAAFDTSVGRLLPQILGAMENTDLAVIRHVSHTLKSSSASIGAVKLSQMCAEMEFMARQGQADGMTDRILSLQTEVGIVRAALHRMLDNGPT